MIADRIFELTSYQIDCQPHIVVNRETCKSCSHRACTHVCPAGCYQWHAINLKIDLAYEACLECGSCLVVCDKGAVKWNYPRGGYGVSFRLT